MLVSIPAGIPLGANSNLPCCQFLPETSSLRGSLLRYLARSCCARFPTGQQVLWRLESFLAIPCRPCRSPALSRPALVSLRPSSLQGSWGLCFAHRQVRPALRRLSRRRQLSCEYSLDAS